MLRQHPNTLRNGKVKLHVPFGRSWENRCKNYSGQVAYFCHMSDHATIPIKNMEIKIICVLAAIRVKESSLEQFLEVFKANIPAILAENGCIEYVPTVDAASNLPPQQLDPAVMTIVEKWESVDALHAHLKSPHRLDYREKTKAMVESMTLKVLTPA